MTCMHGQKHIRCCGTKQGSKHKNSNFTIIIITNSYLFSFFRFMMLFRRITFKNVYQLIAELYFLLIITSCLFLRSVHTHITLVYLPYLWNCFLRTIIVGDACAGHQLVPNLNCDRRYVCIRSLNRPLDSVSRELS